MRDNKRKLLIDLIFTAAISIATYFVAGAYDILERIVLLSKRHGSLNIDQWIMVFVVALFCSAGFACRRWRELWLVKNLTDRRNQELEKALSKTDRLQGLLPICSFCNKIRDEEGRWHRVESYIASHSAVTFTHSICEACTQEHYPEEGKEEER